MDNKLIKITDLHNHILLKLFQEKLIILEIKKEVCAYNFSELG